VLCNERNSNKFHYQLSLPCSPLPTSRDMICWHMVWKSRTQENASRPCKRPSCIHQNAVVMLVALIADCVAGVSLHSLAVAKDGFPTCVLCCTHIMDAVPRPDNNRACRHRRACLDCLPGICDCGSGQNSIIVAEKLVMTMPMSVTSSHREDRICFPPTRRAREEGR